MIINIKLQYNIIKLTSLNYPFNLILIQLLIQFQKKEKNRRSINFNKTKK